MKFERSMKKVVPPEGGYWEDIPPRKKAAPRKGTLTEKAKKHNISVKTVHSRVYILGWSLEKALRVPVDKKKASKKPVFTPIED